MATQSQSLPNPSASARINTELFKHPLARTLRLPKKAAVALVIVYVAA